MIESSAQTQVYHPLWSEEMLTLHRGQVTRQFILHFNITDYILDLDNWRPAPEHGKNSYVPCGNVVGEPMSFNRYLSQLLRSSLGCQSIYTYSLAKGLQVEDPDGYIDDMARQRLHEAWDAVRAEQQAPNQQNDQGMALPEGIVENFKILSYVLGQRYGINGTPLQPDDDGQESPVAVILEYAEKFVSFRLGEGHGERQQLQSLEMLQRWALDPRIRSTRNIIILLTTNIGQIAATLHTAGSGCRAIRIPLPNRDEREAFVRWGLFNKQLITLNPADFTSDLQEAAQQLAHTTQGMRLSDIYNLSNYIWAERAQPDIDPMLTALDVQREKALVIQAQSEELLEILQPRRGFSEIGGLDNLKAYLGQRTNLMRQRKRTLLIPSGLLLAGPPGTGKTIIAEALATESRFNLVKMRNIQDKWVGSSERNLDLVINLLKDLYPVVVFIDEIDQAMVKRDTGRGGGDSGVSARMFARILEEMSNASNRGRILWVAATNRVDLLDAALLRRFDRVIPLLAPDIDEACRIFATMPLTISRQSDDAVNVVYINDLAQRDEQDVQRFHDAAIQVVNQHMTGAGIEIIVRRAAEIAQEKASSPGGEWEQSGYVSDAMESAYEEATGGYEATTQTEYASDDAEQTSFDAQPYEENLAGIDLPHLMKAIRDYIPNHDVNEYNLQSLLAIRACNFHSILPTLPADPVFDNIKDENGLINVHKLNIQIANLRRITQYS